MWGAWDMILDTMDIPYVDSVKILCIRFTSDIRTPHNTEASTNQSSAEHMTCKCLREMTVSFRINFVHTLPFSKT